MLLDATRSGMVTLGSVDHSASVGEPTGKAGGCLRVEKQGALPQQHQVAALLALVRPVKVEFSFIFA